MNSQRANHFLLLAFIFSILLHIVVIYSLIQLGYLKLKPTDSSRLLIQIQTSQNEIPDTAPKVDAKDVLNQSPKTISPTLEAGIQSYGWAHKESGNAAMKSARAIESIKSWLEKTKLNDGLLFRGINNAMQITTDLNCGQINRIYKRFAKDAKLSKEVMNHISGHSMRVGAAQDLLKSGASMPAIMNRVRWSKTDTVMRYLEGVNLN